MIKMQFTQNTAKIMPVPFARSEINLERLLPLYYYFSEII